VNYYPHHIGDFLRDKVHLTAQEDGLYRRMLDVYYASEKPLPLDLDWLCRLVRANTEEEKKSTDVVLRQFFVRRDDGWHNKRADEEICKGRKRIKAAKSNGKKGGRKKTQWVSKNNPVGLQPSLAPKSQKPKEKQAEPDGSLDPVWGPGLQVLLTAGVPEQHARAFVGSLLGSWAPGDVLEALQASSGKADPRGYARGVLRSKPKKTETSERKVAMP